MAMRGTRACNSPEMTENKLVWPKILLKINKSSASSNCFLKSCNYWRCLKS